MSLRYILVDYKMKDSLFMAINVVFTFFPVFFYILMFIHSRMEKNGKMEL